LGRSKAKKLDLVEGLTFKQHPEFRMQKQFI
jgi:hypothetical protein